jgi:HPt (histidine-containing phosphotransfer) domain-containing protein
MFKKRGFDGFISKPIDIRQLNDVLNRFIRDRYPEEAKKYKPETITLSEAPDLNQKVLKIFCGDASRAIATLQETIGNGDLKLLAITAHAMKSALANVGEHDASELAAWLESAAETGDEEYVYANTEGFIQTLEELIIKLSPAADQNLGDANAIEDTAYLKEQLHIIRDACESYDDDAAYAALDRLGEKAWKPDTLKALEEIRDALFIYSDFEGVVKMARALMG